MTLTFGSLFAGIGLLDLGLEWAGMRCLWQVEIDSFCQKVLAKHWPDIERFGDVRECGSHNLPAVDLITGGFPCQPFSCAGGQGGEQDDRNLWPEMRRVVAELRPRWVVAENVPGIRNLYLDTVLSDLEGLDYTAGTVDLPAVAFGAPHIRHRLFIVAHANQYAGQTRGTESARQQRETGITDGGKVVADAAQFARNGKRDGRTDSKNDENNRVYSSVGRGRCLMAHTQEQPVGAGLCQDEQTRQRRRRPGNGDSQDRCQWTTEPRVGRVAYGVPNRVDRLRALGNAVVPQVAEWLGRRILEVEATL